MKYYPRDIELSLASAARHFRVIVLTGARQTGKSTVLQKLFGKTHRYVTLDNPRDLSLAKSDPEFFFKEYGDQVILDEIQRAPELLLYIKQAVDKSSKKGRFILTGSQQFEMMKNLQETLAGRAALFHLLPMAVGEGPAKHKDYIWRSLHGSYPEIVCSSGHDSARWYASYVATFIERDVQPFYRLEKIAHFRDFLFLLGTRNAQTLNYQSLASDLGVSIHAIKYWTKILETAGIIYLLRPYYRNLGSRIIKSPKVYFCDNGLVSYLTATQTKPQLLRGPMAGAMFENHALQETLKFFVNRGLIPPVYYFRSNNGLEVDLVIERKPGQLLGFEIKSSATPRIAMASSLTRLDDLAQKKQTRFLSRGIICLAEKAFPIARDIQAWSVPEYLAHLASFFK